MRNKGNKQQVFEELGGRVYVNEIVVQKALRCGHFVVIGGADAETRNQRNTWNDTAARHGNPN